MTSKETENSPKEISRPRDAFTGEFYQMFEEKLVSILHTLFQKTEKERTCRNSLCKAIVILITKIR